ncbi:MAG: hypothetical protein HZB19_12640 [Chloroflexi bacterium]|nr:hypothetical protein [Chloroflexota bacterium]
MAAMALFDDYLRVVEQLLRELTPEHPRYADLFTLQGRLNENIQNTNLHGDTPELRADRSRILGELNKIALEATGQSFNELATSTRRIHLNRITQQYSPAIQSRNPAPSPHTPLMSHNENDEEGQITNLGSPAWQGVGAIATIIFGILGIAVAIIIALIEFDIIDIHSLTP